jgi:hypothetical protein
MEMDTSNLEFSIGWATKALNIYLKTLYYIGDFEPKGVRKILHPPIDNILVKNIQNHYNITLWSIHQKSFSISRLDKYDKYMEMIQKIKEIALKNNMINILDIEHVWTIEKTNISSSKTN